METGKHQNYLKNELYQLIKEDSSIFEFIQHGSLDGIWYWDLEDPEQEWMSPKFWETLGYDSKEKKHLSAEWKDIIFQEDLDKAYDNFYKHCDDPNYPYDQTVRYKHKDGSTIWIRCRGMAIRDKSGKPVRMLGAHSDVTEMRLLIDAVHQEKDNINAIFESSPIAMLTIDETTSITSANAAALKLCGEDLEKIIHHRPGDAIGCAHSFDDLKGCGHGPECPLCPIRKGLEGLIDSKGGRIHKAEVEVSLKRNNEFKNVWLELGAETIVINGHRQVCIALEDITDRKHMEKDIIAYQDMLVKTNEVLSERLEQTLMTISKIGEARDSYTAGHQKRVSDLACAIASEMGLPDDTIKNIKYGSQIHDIGKVCVAMDILNKPGKITNLEYKIIQTHVDLGYDIIKDIDFPRQISMMIYQHHERLDGSGYPQGLKGDQIIIESRILAVADVVEAMTSHRPYRHALGLEMALDEVISNKGTRYDRNVVDACVKLINEKGYQFPTPSYN